MSDANDGPKAAPRGDGAKGCGCQAAAAFLILIGLPVILMFSFGLSPCADGPCDPDGRSKLTTAALVLAAAAAAIGVATWQLTAFWHRRQAARGKDGRRQIEIAAIVLLALAATAGFALIVT